jgi:DNA-binding MarR family transcriptional regulator
MKDNGGRYGERVASIGPLQAGQVLDSAGARTGFALTILGESFQRHIREVLAGHDLKPRQLRILDLLADRGPVGQRELAELMGIDHSVLVGLLNPLEAARLVKRQRDTVDRRRHVVSIAAAGQRRLAEADQAFRDAEDGFFAPLSAQERDQLHAMLSRLREATGYSADHDR